MEEKQVPAYEIDYRGRVHCEVCGQEERRLHPELIWPKHCGRDMTKGSFAKKPRALQLTATVE